MTDEEQSSETEEASTIQDLNLEDAFNDEEQTGEEVNEETETEEESSSEEETEVEEESTSDVADHSETSGLKAALKAERLKRQTAEQKLKEQNKKDVPDPIDDPEGYASYLKDENNQSAFKIKTQISRDMMVDSKDDYEVKEKVFLELAQDNPHLVKQMKESNNPARFAYQTALDHLEVQKIKSPEYQKTLREEIKAEILKELSTDITSGKKSALDMPDLTKATASGKNGVQKEPEETLEEMFEE